MSYSQSASALMQSLHGNGQEKHALLLDASSGHDIVVPGGSFLLTAQFHRSGGDLILVGKDGQEVVVQGYFDSHNPPRLMTEFGAVIDGELAAKLAGPEAGALVAADGNAGQQLQAIGQVQKLSGHAHVKHANGATEDLVQGSTIYKGDVVETEGDGAVGLVFADRSTFSLGKNGRMVMDEMVYDPEAHTGKAAMSVVQGTFSFVSGQIAKSGPDAMSVKTPVMTIGIRGTTVAGTAAAEGSQNTVALLSDEDGGVGQIVVSNASGQTQVLSSPNQTMQLSSSFQAPPAPVVMPASQLHQIMPDLHNVQESRPSQPTADPVIHNNSTGTNSTGAGPAAAPAAAPDAKAEAKPEAKAGDTPAATNGKEGTTASGESASGGELNMHTTNATLDAVTGQTTTAVTTAQTNVVASSTSTSTTAVSTASSAGIPLQGTSSSSTATTTPTTTTPTATTPTTTTAATSTLTTTDSASTTSTSVTHDSSGNYTLVGGSASTVYAESSSYLTASDAVDLGLAHSSWTLFAEAHAATVMLSSVTDRVSTVTDHFYAGTSSTAADSSSPTLSLANLTAGATISMSSSAELLMTISNSTDAKTTIADGFHHVVGSSHNDTVSLREGFYLQLDGGAGTDFLTAEAASSALTVDLGNSLTSGTSVIAATNFEYVTGSDFNDLFHLGTQSLTLNGGLGTDTVSLDEISLNSTVNMSSGSVHLSNGAIDIFSNIEVVALGNGTNTLIVETADGYSVAGGTGYDTADYSDNDQALTFTLNGHSSITVAGSSTDHLSSFETLIGGSGGFNLFQAHGLTGLLGLYGNTEALDKFETDVTANLTAVLGVDGWDHTTGWLNWSGGSIYMKDIATLAGGLGADVLSMSHGTGVLEAGYVWDASTLSQPTGTSLHLPEVTYLDGLSGNFKSVLWEDNSSLYLGSWDHSSTAVLSSVALSTVYDGTNDIALEALSDNGRYVIYDFENDSQSTIKLYDAVTGHTREIGSTTDALTTLAVDRSGREVVAGYWRDTGEGSVYVARLMSTVDGQLIKTVNLGVDAPDKVGFLTDGQLYYHEAGSEALVSYDAYNGATNVLNDINGTTYSLDGAVWDVNGTGNKVALWNGNSLLLLNNIQGTVTALLTNDDVSSIDKLAISANGRFIAAYADLSSSSGELVVLDSWAHSSTVLHTGGSADLGSDGVIKLTDDGRYVMAVDSSGGQTVYLNPYATADLASNTLIGGDGEVTLMGGMADVTASLMAVSTAHLLSINAGNTLVAGTGYTRMAGGGGSNDFIVGSGEVSITGGGYASEQLLDLRNTSDSVFVDLRDWIFDPSAGELVVGAMTSHLVGVGNVIGGSGDATLIGTTDANTIMAGTGSHVTINGGGGADQIFVGTHTAVLEISANYHAETVHLYEPGQAGTAALLEIEPSGMTGGFKGAKVSGNDAVFYFTPAGGGGSTVLENFFTSSTTAEIVDTDGSTELLLKDTTGTLVSGTINGNAFSLSEINGNTGSDMIFSSGNSALLIGMSTAELFSAGFATDSLGSDDFIIQGKGDVVIGGAARKSSAFFDTLNTSTWALYADLTKTVNETAVLSGHTAVLAMNQVRYGGATSYLYGINEIHGTNNGDTLIGGTISMSESSSSDRDTQFVVGTGSNIVADAGYYYTDHSYRTSNYDASLTGNGASSYTSGSHGEPVMVDYSREISGITANLDSYDTGSVFTYVYSSTVTEIMARSGTVVHNGGASTDILFGIEDIRGSAYDDTITTSLYGGYIQSSKGNDAYHNPGSNTVTLDYSDSDSPVFVNLGGSGHSVTATMSDGHSISVWLYASSVLHDYSNGGIYTDDLSGNFMVRLGSYGGWLIGGNSAVLDMSEVGSGSTIEIGTSNVPTGFSGYAHGWSESYSIDFTNVSSIMGTSGADTLVLSGDSGSYSFDGGDGTNALSLADTDIAMTADLNAGTVDFGSSGSISLTNVEIVYGSDNGAVLIADYDGGSTLIGGGGGSSTIIGGAGEGYYDGGSASNGQLLYAETGHGITVDLGLHTAVSDGSNAQTVLNFEIVEGSIHDDKLIAGSSDVTLFGGNGNDTLVAGAGTDSLYGGDGNDAFYVTASLGGTTSIDGGDGSDTLHLTVTAAEDSQAFQAELWAYERLLENPDSATLALTFTTLGNLTIANVEALSVTVSGTPSSTWAAAVPTTNVLHFNGSSSLEASSVSGLSTGDVSFTMGTWFRSTGTTTDNDWLITLGSDINSGGVNSDFGITLHDNGKVGVDIRGVANQPLSDSTYDDGNWHYIAASYDSSSGDVKLYVDGVLVTENTGQFVNLEVTSVYLGNRYGSDRNFLGDLSDVGIWGEVLSQTDVQSVISSGSAAVEGGSLVANWGTGLGLTDAAGGNDLSVQAGTYSTASLFYDIASNGNWEDTSSWTPGALPTLDDSVYITDHSVTLSDNESVADFHLIGATLEITDADLYSHHAASLDLNSVLSLDGATLSMGGSLEADGTVSMSNGSTINLDGDLMLYGTLSGDGTVSAISVGSGAHLHPVGDLIIDNDLLMNQNAYIDLDVASSDNKLTVSGQLDLMSSSLELSYSSTSLQSSAEQTILEFGSTTDNFQSIDGMGITLGSSSYVFDPKFYSESMTLTAHAVSAAVSTSETGKYLLASSAGSVMDGTGNATGDVMVGQAGDDTLIVGTTGFDFLTGGDGLNVLQWGKTSGGASTDMDLTAVRADLVEKLQIVDLSQNGGTTLTLDSAHVATMSGGRSFGTLGGESVLVVGSSSDTVNLIGWTNTGTTQTVHVNNSSDTSYAVYTKGDEHVLVDSNITHVVTSQSGP